MADILLTTINARYQHASLGLRCLMANLGHLTARASMLEFVSGAQTEDMVERILAQNPRIVGIGVYIWNVDACTRLVAQLRCIAPSLCIVIGGPEVSHETTDQRICALADHVVTGAGELAFAALCRAVLEGPRPLMRVIPGGAPAPETLRMPYRLYDDRDLRERHVYVEASRGCPFRCEFCLSSLDRTAEPFPLAPFLAEMTELHTRGARRFRFIDRTFNLKIDTSVRILSFFLAIIEANPADPVFLHFELVPDHLPERLRALILRFPAGTLQFEIGIQTWNPAVQALIGRRQDNDRASANLAWLARQTQAHLHVDLIAGLPGEDSTSFGAGFDRLVALQPHEIQVGILKRLRGTPIIRHTAPSGMRYNPDPPYNVLATDLIAFDEMQRIARFARYWDLFANAGRFPRAMRLLLDARPFARFMAFSEWLHRHLDATHRIALERRAELLHEWLRGDGGVPAAEADAAVRDDYARSGARGRPAFLSRGVRGAPDDDARPAATPARQARHLDQR